MTKTIERRSPWPVEFYRSAVGKKWVMAVTGIVLLVFVLAHMIGNLKVYLGAEEIDVYAESLRTLLHPLLPNHVFLWTLRVVVLVAALFHVHATTTLTLINHRSRSIEYQGPRAYLAANYASRTMRWSGYIVLAWLLFHLADFTWGTAPLAPDTWARGAVYANMVAGFSRPAVSALYIFANLVLGVHIYHGAWSMFQSLGINHPGFNKWRRWFAIAFAGVVTVGNVSIPIAVLTGFVA